MKRKAKQLEVNLFTGGDSSDIRTWSNLPYFFSKSLIKQGIRVNRINLVPTESLFFKFYCRFILKHLVKLRKRYIDKDYRHSPYRDHFIGFLTNRKIKREQKKYPDARCNIFLTFSFSSWRYSLTPVVHYCDRTYEQYLQNVGKPIKKWDRHFVHRERLNLWQAHLIFGTSKQCCDFIRADYGLNNVRKLMGGPNMERGCRTGEKEALACKLRNKEILFVGIGVRRRGADILIKAFNIFNARNNHEFKLNIVGISEGEARAEITESFSNITFFPYLNKSDPVESEVYYNLYETARMFVIPMRDGPPPGVIMEAVALYTPVVTTRVYSDEDELIKDGYNGILIDSFRPEAFAETMDRLVKNGGEWETLALNAYLSSRNRSWDSMVKKFIAAINSLPPEATGARQAR